MRRIYRFFVLMFLFVFSFAVNIQALGFGEYALKYLEQISRIPRVAFTEGEVYTADYLGRILRDLGYDTVFEEIAFPEDTVVNFEQGYYLSHNIIATKKGTSDLEVIIGSAYDSEEVEGSTGFEGATGVSLLLEIATRVKNIQFPFTLKFVLFGCGSVGNIGQTHYVSTRSQDELNNIMYFLDLSSIGSGKDLYVYGNAGDKGFVRDELIDLSKEMGIELLTPNEDEEMGIPYGVSSDVGGQVPFKYSNVPFGKIEATSLDSIDEEYGLPDDPTGEGVGIIQGSSNDNYEYVMSKFEDNVVKHLEDASKLIYNSLVRDSRSIKIITQLSQDNSEKFQNIKYQLYKDGKKLHEKQLDDSMITEFDDLDEGSYSVKVVAPDDFNFIKNIAEFEFVFKGDSKGEFVFVNDEVDTYTYREEFTDNYNSVRESIKESQFEIRSKKLLFDYASETQGDYNDDEDDLKTTLLIKNLSILLGILVVCYVILRIILSKINNKE